MALPLQRLQGAAGSRAQPYSHAPVVSSAFLHSSSSRATAECHAARRFQGASCSGRVEQQQQQQQQQHGRRMYSVVTRASNPLGALVFREGYTEVEEVLGMRLRMEGDTPQTQYLVKWKVSREKRLSLHGPHQGSVQCIQAAADVWVIGGKGVRSMEGQVYCKTLQMLRKVIAFEALALLMPGVPVCTAMPCRMVPTAPGEWRAAQRTHTATPGACGNLDMLQ